MVEVFVLTALFYFLWVLKEFSTNTSGSVHCHLVGVVGQTSTAINKNWIKDSKLVKTKAAA